MEELNNLKRKIEKYHEVIANTNSYREVWSTSLKEFILNKLNEIVENTDLQAKVEEKVQLANLSAISLSLGTQKSGIAEIVNGHIEKPLLKQNGMLVYQQLFNGKVQVLIFPPYIEGHGEPKPPKMIGIYRPEEIKDPYIVRHCEEFIKDVTEWEDFDDDDPPQVNYGHQIGFNIGGNQKK